MDWIQVLVIVLANLGVMVTLFLWVRSEGNADRRELTQFIREIQAEIQAEMKDFHGRLCAIEERRK